ncbi:hypothetical protein ABZS63_25120, partial [Streptomyces sp. NPDC005568]
EQRHARAHAHQHRARNPAHALQVVGARHVEAVLLLTMTAVTATMTNNRRVEAALRAATPADAPDHPASRDEDFTQESASH